MTCNACHVNLVGSYYQAGGQILCESCVQGLRAVLHGKEGQTGRVLKAIGMGIGGGILGGAVYAAVLALAHINAALITILIGWLVGKGVRRGAGGRGGRGYQALAVAITYLSIGFFASLADVLGPELRDNGFLASAAICIVGAFIGPVLMGTHSLFGAIITVFGLLQAWQLCGAIKIDISGPHKLAPVPTAPAPAPASVPPTPSIPPSV